jgi:SPP1 family predicted phage head-tail adaptor
VSAFPIGQARQRAVLEAKVLTADGGGGYAESWEPYAIVWAALTMESGAKPMEAGRPEMRISCRAVIRRRGDISINHRMRIGERLFAIRAIVDEGPQSSWMTLLCEEGAPS